MLRCNHFGRQFPVPGLIIKLIFLGIIIILNKNPVWKLTNFTFLLSAPPISEYVAHGPSTSRKQFPYLSMGSSLHKQVIFLPLSQLPLLLPQHMFDKNRELFNILQHLRHLRHDHFSCIIAKGDNPFLAKVQVLTKIYLLPYKISSKFLQSHLNHSDISTYSIDPPTKPRPNQPAIKVHLTNTRPQSSSLKPN